MIQRFDLSDRRAEESMREREERRSERMLHIRLSKGSSGDGGGGPAKPSLPLETVTVACPDHLVLAELPVAKSLGAVTASALSSVRSVGRRSRRNPGQKVHICVRCDFPIAIYGRINPCDHAFCMACARSVSSCFLCDERVQKIQTIKMMEGIFICAAPHCLKSFLKSSEFESHVSEVHADLLQPDVEMEGGNENDVISIMRPSSADPHRQSLPPESSTARAPPRSGFSPSSNSQLQDREERPRRHQSREQPPPRPPLQPRPPQYHSRQQNQPGDPQPENNAAQGFDKPYNWFQQTQNSENQSGPRYRRDSDQLPSDKQTGIPPESPFSNYPPPLPLQPPNYPLPVNSIQALAPTPSFSYPPFPTDGPQPYYSAPYEVPRQESVAEAGSEHGSVLGIPPAPTAVASFPDNYPRPWGMTFMGMSFPSQQMGQGVPEGFGNPTDPHGGVSFFQGDYGRLPEGLLQNSPHPGKELEPQGGPADHTDNKGVLAPLPLPMSYPPPPLLPPPLPQQLNSSKFSSSGGGSQEGQAYGWHNDRRE